MFTTQAVSATSSLPPPPPPPPQHAEQPEGDDNVHMVDVEGYKEGHDTGEEEEEKKKKTGYFSMDLDTGRLEWCAPDGRFLDLSQTVTPHGREEQEEEVEEKEEEEEGEQIKHTRITSTSSSSTSSSLSIKDQNDYSASLLFFYRASICRPCSPSSLHVALQADPWCRSTLSSASSSTPLPPPPPNYVRHLLLFYHRHVQRSCECGDPMEPTQVDNDLVHSLCLDPLLSVEDRLLLHQDWSQRVESLLWQQQERVKKDFEANLDAWQVSMQRYIDQETRLIHALSLSSLSSSSSSFPLSSPLTEDVHGRRLTKKECNNLQAIQRRWNDALNQVSSVMASEREERERRHSTSPNERKHIMTDSSPFSLSSSPLNWKGQGDPLPSLPLRPLQRFTFYYHNLKTRYMHCLELCAILSLCTHAIEIHWKEMETYMRPMRPYITARESYKRHCAHQCPLLSIFSPRP